MLGVECAVWFLALQFVDFCLGWRVVLNRFAVAMGDLYVVVVEDDNVVGAFAFTSTLAVQVANALDTSLMKRLGSNLFAGTKAGPPLLSEFLR